MKKSFMSMMVALFVLLVSASFAQAAANPYVSLSAGVGFLTNSNGESEMGGDYEDLIEYSSGYVVNGALGLDADMFRLEGAVGYQVNELDAFAGESMEEDSDVEVSILSFMANGYVDFESEGSSVTPYVMAGLGVATVAFDDDGEEVFDDTAFAYQFGAGVGIQATPNVIIDLGYRYFATSDIDGSELPDAPSDATIDIDSHNLMAGVRFGF